MALIEERDREMMLTKGGAAHARAYGGIKLTMVPAPLLGLALASAPARDWRGDIVRSVPRLTALWLIFLAASATPGSAARDYCPQRVIAGVGSVLATVLGQRRLWELPLAPATTPRFGVAHER